MLGGKASFGRLTRPGDPDQAKTTRLSNVAAQPSPWMIFHEGKCGYRANDRLRDEAWPRGMSVFGAVRATFIASATSHYCWPSVFTLTSRGVGKSVRTSLYGPICRPNERRGCGGVELQAWGLKCDSLKRYDLP